MMRHLALPESFFVFDCREVAAGEYITAVLDREKIAQGWQETYFIGRHDGYWRYLCEVNWQVVALCRGPAEQLLAAGADGQIVAVGMDGAVQEDDLRSYCNEPVSLRTLKNLGGTAVALGYGGLICQRPARGQWHCLRLDTASGWLESIAERDGVGRYAVGLGGEVWWGAGEHWSSIDYPSNCNLHDVHITASGEVYICGAAGHLGLGQGERWRLLDTAGLNEDLWKVFVYQDTLYLATMAGLYQYDGQGLRPSSLMDHGACRHYYNAQAAISGLLVADERSIVSFSAGQAQVLLP